MQILQDLNQNSTNNLNNVRREARRHFKKRRKYLKAKFDYLETNSKIKNYQRFV